MLSTHLSWHSLLTCGDSAYYWGCGEYYQLHKHEFSHLHPRYILLDKNSENLVEKDGIPVRHPAEILPHGKKLPIVIFAHDPVPILRTIAAKHPWHEPFGHHICVTVSKQKKRKAYA